MISTPNYEPEYIRSLFNKMSGTYERVNYITSFGFSLRWRHQFLHSVPHTTEKLKVIDLMTGMGETWGALKKRIPNSQFTALDFSEGMMKQAAVRNKRHFNNEVELVCRNVLESGLPSDNYDVVISAFGVKTFNEKQLSVLAGEVKRILKPGGYFSFIEVSKPQPRVLRSLYKLHLKHVVPLCGKVLLGNPEEYKMLWRYTDNFSNADRLAEIFSAKGLKVKRESYFNDCATGICGNKI